MPCASRFAVTAEHDCIYFAEPFDVLASCANEMLPVCPGGNASGRKNVVEDDIGDGPSICCNEDGDLLLGNLPGSLKCQTIQGLSCAFLSGPQNFLKQLC